MYIYTGRSRTGWRRCFTISYASPNPRPVRVFPASPRPRNFFLQESPGRLAADLNSYTTFRPAGPDFHSLFPEDVPTGFRGRNVRVSDATAQSAAAGSSTSFLPNQSRPSTLPDVRTTNSIGRESCRLLWSRGKWNKKIKKSSVHTDPWIVTCEYIYAPRAFPWTSVPVTSSMLGFVILIQYNFQIFRHNFIHSHVWKTV